MDVLLIKAGLVENVIAADSVERALSFYPEHLCIERTALLAHVGPGFTTVDDGQSFEPPAPPPVPPLDLRITRYAFLRRFLDSEAIAIDLASIGATVQAATLRRYMNLINTAQWIDLADPMTRGGVQQLEAAGVLAEGRALQILDGPVLDPERPGITAATGSEA